MSHGRVAVDLPGICLFDFAHAFVTESDAMQLYVLYILCSDSLLWFRDIRSTRRCSCATSYRDCGAMVTICPVTVHLCSVIWIGNDGYLEEHADAGTEPDALICGDERWQRLQPGCPFVCRLDASPMTGMCWLQRNLVVLYGSDDVRIMTAGNESVTVPSVVVLC